LPTLTSVLCATQILFLPLLYLGGFWDKPGRLPPSGRVALAPEHLSSGIYVFCLLTTTKPLSHRSPSLQENFIICTIYLYHRRETAPLLRQERVEGWVDHHLQHLLPVKALLHHRTGSLEPSDTRFTGQLPACANCATLVLSVEATERGGCGCMVFIKF